MHTIQWNELVDEYYEPIYRFCFHFLGAKSDAEDAVQETFLKAFRTLDSLRERTKARAWLYTIARNVCCDKSRWWKRLFAVQDSLQHALLSESDADLSLTLRALIAQLPRRQREVFVLRHVHEFSTEETAKMLGIETGSVKSHLKRAVDKLKVELEERQPETLSKRLC